MTPKTKITDLTHQPDTARDRIIAHAQKLFLATGFKSVTMGELAAELGMSKKTLYQHFASKDELLRTAINAKFDQIESELAAVLKQKGKSSADLLGELLACLQKHVSQITPAFVRDVQKSEPGLFAMIDGRRQIVICTYFGALLKKGRRDGCFRRDVPVDVMIEILLASARSIVTPARLVHFGLSPQKAFSQVLSVFLNGIITNKAP